MHSERRSCNDRDVDALFARHRATGDRTIRNELVTRHLWLAERCARRYWDRGEQFDDLVQVGRLGLLKAVERYDPDRGPFVGYAIPTITGELKRHFRDSTWTVAVPRRPKELRGRVSAATEALRQTLERSPTVDEVAEFTELPREHVIETLGADRVYRPLSLDKPSRGGGRRSVGDGLLDPQESPGLTETTLITREALTRLGERERFVVYLTYFEGWTQREIGSRLGLGQVQVSRILRGALASLRRELEGGRIGAA